MRQKAFVYNTYCALGSFVAAIVCVLGEVVHMARADDTPTPFATVVIYVDPVNGSNFNIGTTPQFPVADLAGAANRLEQMQAHIGSNPAKVILTPWQ